jgi:hypothetical protein
MPAVHGCNGLETISITPIYWLKAENVVISHGAIGPWAGACANVSAETPQHPME